MQKNQNEPTIAKILNIKEFPFVVKDKNGRTIYSENIDGTWWRKEYEGDLEVYFEDYKNFWYKQSFKEGKSIYYESSVSGVVRDDRPKYNKAHKSCKPSEDKTLFLDGKKYKLVEIKE